MTSSSNSHDELYVTAQETLKTSDISSISNDTSFYSVRDVTLSPSHDSGIACSSPDVDFGVTELIQSPVQFEFVDASSMNELRASEGIVESSSPAYHNKDSFAMTSSSDKMVSSSDSVSSLVILSASHNALESSGDRKSVSESVDVSNEVGDSFIKQLLRDAYEEDGETSQPCAQSSPSKQEGRQKIYIRELSFDELKDVQGVDLMAPVFLAVTDEADDSIGYLRRKAKSIEDLCSPALLEADNNSSRQRSRSELPHKPKSTRYKSSPLSQDTNFYGLTYDGDKSQDEVKERLVSLTMSNTSGERTSSVASDQYNESIDDSLEDQAIIDVFVNNGMYDSVANDSSFDMLKDLNDSSVLAESRDCSLTPVGGEDEDDVRESTQHPSDLKFFNETAGDLKRNPSLVKTSCGYWEYPFGDGSSTSPKTPTFARQLSINTSPKSSMRPSNLTDRYVVVGVAGQQRVVDMKLIEPYLKILSHGGHHMVDGERRVIVVFSACYLPIKTVEKYHIILEQLFYYFVHAVDLLVVETYEIVFFNSHGKNMPPLDWIKQCYDTINYRLKKNLRHVYFVHQSLWLKTLLRFSKFFVSAKFRKKIHLIKNIKVLKNFVPLEYIFIPPEIYSTDQKFT